MLSISIFNYTYYVLHIIQFSMISFGNIYLTIFIIYPKLEII